MTIKATCDLCDIDSSYDEESFKASIKKVNGNEILICCPCEDDLFLQLLKARMSKERMEELLNTLMSDERDEILELYYKYKEEDDEDDS